MTNDDGLEICQGFINHSKKGNLALAQRLLRLGPILAQFVQAA